MRAEIYKDEGYRMMGAAFEVYNERGFGLGEEIYQECVEIELGLRSIPFTSKLGLACYYKDRELQKHYVPDLFVFGCLIVELNAVSQLLPEHESQLINYLRLSRKSVGYLVNFGRHESLQWNELSSQNSSQFRDQRQLAEISGFKMNCARFPFVIQPRQASHRWYRVIIFRTAIQIGLALF